MDEDTELKAYICKDISQDEGEVGAYRNRGPEKWRTEAFIHYWEQTDDSELFGAHHEVRYAMSLEELKTQMEIEDPAPVGCTFYKLWHHTNGRRPRSWYNDRLNRLYRARHPIAEFSDAIEIVETAEKEKKLLIWPDDAMDHFKEIVEDFRDFEHVAPISDTCVIKPKGADKGPLYIVYNPRLVKQMRTKDVNDKKRAEEKRKKVAADLEKERRASEREAAREKLSKKRIRILSTVSTMLTVGLEYILERDAPHIVDISRCTAHNEYEWASRVIELLKAYDNLKVGAECLLDPRHRMFKKLREVYTAPKSMKAGRVLSAFIKSPARHLGVYQTPQVKRKCFPSGSGITAEPPKGHNYKPDQDNAKMYIELYKRLAAIVKTIRAGRLQEKLKKEASAA